MIQFWTHQLSLTAEEVGSAGMEVCSLIIPADDLTHVGPCHFAAGLRLSITSKCVNLLL